MFMTKFVSTVIALCVRLIELHTQGSLIPWKMTAATCFVDTLNDFFCFITSSGFVGQRIILETVSFMMKLN